MENKVYLDLRGLNDLDRKFPHLYKALLQVGINPLKDVIPLSPAAHYSIGGIAVDIYYRTEIKNLYAIGEVAATGMHGTNRLAGNSGLECIASGLEVVRTIIRDNPRAERRSNANAFYDPDIDIYGLKELREIMWRYVGIMRDGSILKKALTLINDLSLPRQLRELVKGIIICAMAREGSRGTHYRMDYPHMRRRYEARSKYNKGMCVI